jgi:hypothetical protein
MSVAEAWVAGRLERARSEGGGACRSEGAAGGVGALGGVVEMLSAAGVVGEAVRGHRG